MSETTFGSWLDEQSARGDAIGEIAAAWHAAQGTRPRRFAVKSVTSWVIEHAGQFQMSPPALVQLMETAAAEYRGARPAYDPARDEPAVPVRQVGAGEFETARRQAFAVDAAPALEDLPDADPAERADSLLTGDSEADLASAFRASTGKEPPPRRETDVLRALSQVGQLLGDVLASQQRSERVQRDMSQRLDRIEVQQADSFAQVMRMLGDIKAGQQSLDQRFAQHEQALEPLRQVLDEIASADEDEAEADDLAEAEAEARERGSAGLVADLQATQPGTPGAPETVSPQALYGPYGQQTAQPDPSWAAIDAAVQPADLAEEDQPWRAGGEQPGE